MLGRLVTVGMVVAVMGFAGALPASAGDFGGQDDTASVQASGGQLTVQAGVTYWAPPSASQWATDAQSDPPSHGGGTPNPNQPYGCTYKADPTVEEGLGAGGPTPGEWMVVTCSGPGAVDPMPLLWVSGAQAAPAAPAVDPAVVAEQAEQQLALGSPTIEMAPPTGSPQLVGVATWLWIDPAAWQARTATATAGPVTATATATPTQVVWAMGNGQDVTCDGSGTPYDPSEPQATTDCSYTWGEPGSYQVTATVTWSVAWTATGAPGGGALGPEAGAPAQVTVTVEESQAINTQAPGGT